MNIFHPITVGFRLFNAAGTAWVCGKIGLAAYRHIRSLQTEKLRASELRARFVEAYTKHNGQEPTEDEIQVALEAYNTSERPVLAKSKKFVERVGKAVQECVEGEWLERWMKKKAEKERKEKGIKVDE